MQIYYNVGMIYNVVCCCYHFYVWRSKVVLFDREFYARLFPVLFRSSQGDMRW